jgi:hypothetical protein
LEETNINIQNVKASVWRRGCVKNMGFLSVVKVFQKKGWNLSFTANADFCAVKIGFKRYENSGGK